MAVNVSSNKGLIMKLTDKKIVDALAKDEYVTREAFYDTVWMVKSSG